MSKKKAVTVKSWDEFRSTGLFLFVNQFLHIFGWALVIECDEGCDNVKSVYPARVVYRGFDVQSQGEDHIKLAKYMVGNAPELLEEAES
jgi:hypothetical protein